MKRETEKLQCQGGLFKKHNANIEKQKGANNSGLSHFQLHHRHKDINTININPRKMIIIIKFVIIIVIIINIMKDSGQEKEIQQESLGWSCQELEAADS